MMQEVISLFIHPNFNLISSGLGVAAGMDKIEYKDQVTAKEVCNVFYVHFIMHCLV